MKYLFTSESVSEGHPDKMADQISDALLDNYLAFDKNSKVACETLVTTDQVIIAGEIKSNSKIDQESHQSALINVAITPLDLPAELLTSIQERQSSLEQENKELRRMIEAIQAQLDAQN